MRHDRAPGTGVDRSDGPVIGPRSEQNIGRDKSLDLVPGRKNGRVLAWLHGDHHDGIRHTPFVPIGGMILDDTVHPHRGRSAAVQVYPPHSLELLLAKAPQFRGRHADAVAFGATIHNNKINILIVVADSRARVAQVSTLIFSVQNPTIREEQDVASDA